MSPTFGKNLTAKTNAINKNGTNNQKIQCHERIPKIIPASVGPTAGANMMTKPIIPIADPNL